MTKQPVSVNQTLCQIYEINYSLATPPCDQCGQPAVHFTTATRTAIDLDLDHPILLHLTVSIHHWGACQHYFRVHPPFLRRDAVYTNRVITKAVQSVYQEEAGIDPAEVITDGSSLYPAVLGKAWPQAAHQLCLFHETRRVTGAVIKLINAVRRNLPSPPTTSNLRGARSLRVGSNP